MCLCHSRLVTSGFTHYIAFAKTPNRIRIAVLSAHFVCSDHWQWSVYFFIKYLGTISFLGGVQTKRIPFWLICWNHKSIASICIAIGGPLSHSQAHQNFGLASVADIWFQTCAWAGNVLLPFLNFGWFLHRYDNTPKTGIKLATEILISISYQLFIIPDNLTP